MFIAKRILILMMRMMSRVLILSLKSMNLVSSSLCVWLSRIGDLLIDVAKPQPSGHGLDCVQSRGTGRAPGLVKGFCCDSG